MPSSSVSWSCGLSYSALRSWSARQSGALPMMTVSITRNPSKANWSWRSTPNFFGRETVPLGGSNSPERIFMSVDFPAPLGPAIAYRLPARNVQVTASNRILAPKRMEMFWMESKDTSMIAQAGRLARRGADPYWAVVRVGRTHQLAAIRPITDVTIAGKWKYVACHGFPTTGFQRVSTGFYPTVPEAIALRLAHRRGNLGSAIQFQKGELNLVALAEAGFQRTTKGSGIWSHVRPSSVRPAFFLLTPPHCLKKNSTPERRH